MDISNYLDTAILALIAAAVGFVVRYGFAIATDLIIKSHAVTLVKAAESIYSGQGLGDAKYQFAADALVAFAAKLHVKLDAARVKAYIQAAVTDLHAALGTAISTTTSEIKASQVAAETPTVAPASATPAK